MNIIDSLLKKITGHNPADIRSEDERQAYKWLYRWTLIMLCLGMTIVPLAVYFLLTDYIPFFKR
jgi:hypothetical protein